MDRQRFQGFLCVGCSPSIAVVFAQAVGPGGRATSSRSAPGRRCITASRLWLGPIFEMGQSVVRLRGRWRLPGTLPGYPAPSTDCGAWQRPGRGNGGVGKRLHRRGDVTRHRIRARCRGIPLPFTMWWCCQEHTAVQWTRGAPRVLSVCMTACVMRVATRSRTAMGSKCTRDAANCSPGNARFNSVTSALQGHALNSRPVRRKIRPSFRPPRPLQLKSCTAIPGCQQRPGSVLGAVVPDGPQAMGGDAFAKRSDRLCRQGMRRGVSAERSGRLLQRPAGSEVDNDQKTQ